MTLVRVGFFREQPHGRPSDLSLAEQVQPDPAPDEMLVVGYLRAGAVLVATPGISPDLLDPDAGPAGAPHLQTDGEHVWPGDLAYYVQTYHVRLPEEFRTAIRRRDGRPPELDETTLAALDRELFAG